MTNAATDEQIAELEALLEGYAERLWEFPPVSAQEIHALIARIRAAEAEKARIRNALLDELAEEAAAEVEGFLISKKEPTNDG